ncbi:FATC domain containing protein [Trichuris trichiura]|uniref:FATC domain containing protein n=1 Tax=Trichuris trichiura TaxID=36087 RepID=A0A077Z9W0_TRITR|nr:FATC domain containing protein [Trichuris trichiura]
MLRCKSATLLKLFDAFIYDPLIDWTTGYPGDGHGTVVQNIIYALHPSSFNMHQYKEAAFQLKKQLFCLYCRDALVQWNCYNERLWNALEAYRDSVMKVSVAESAIEEIEKELQLLRDRNIYLAEAKGDINHPIFTLSQRFGQYRSIDAKSGQLLARLKATSQFYDHLVNSYECDNLKNSLLLTYQNLRHLLASTMELMPAYIELQRYMPVEFRNSYFVRKWLKLINDAIEVKSTNDSKKLEVECNDLLNEDSLRIKDASASEQAQKSCHSVEAAFSTVSERSAKLPVKDFSNSFLELSLCHIYSTSSDFLKVHVMKIVREKLLYVLEKVMDFNEHRTASSFREFDPDFELKDMVVIMKHIKAAQQFLNVIQSETFSSVVALVQCFERVFNQLLHLIRELTLEVIPELFGVAAVNRGAIVKLLDLLMHFNTSSAVTWDSLYDDLVVSKIVVCVKNPLYISTLQSQASCLFQENLPEGLEPIQPVVKQILDQYSMLETVILDLISLVTEAEQSDQFKIRNKNDSDLFTPIVADSSFYSTLFLCRYYATYLAFSGVLACSDFLRGFNSPDSFLDVFIQFPKLVVFTLLRQVLYGLASHVLYVVKTNVEERSTPLETEASSAAFKLLEELYRNVLSKWDVKCKQRIALTFGEGLSVVHNVSFAFRWCNRGVVPIDRFVHSELLLQLRKLDQSLAEVVPSLQGSLESLTHFSGEMFSRLNWAAGANKVWTSHLESFKHAVIVDKQKIENTMNTCRQLNLYLNAVISMETLPREADGTLSGNAETVRLVLNYIEISSVLNFEYSKLSQLELKLSNVLPFCSAKDPSRDWLVSLMAKTDQEIEEMNIKRDQSILRFSEAIKSADVYLDSVRAEFSNFFEHTAEISSVVKNFAKLEDNELFGKLHDFVRLCRFHAETAVSIVKSGQMLRNSISMWSKEVNNLLKKARDVDNLALMYEGWTAWV